MRGAFLAIVFMAFAPDALADILDGIRIEPESEDPYNRSYYQHWTDDDDNCLDVRQEVLKAESLVPVELRGDGCMVIGGLWFDPYTGFTFSDPTDVQIDHMVPLQEAHRSGGYAWSPKKRRTYANDTDNPGHLIAVHGGTNASKGSRDIAHWLPPNEDFLCAYVITWVAIKRKWGLSVDPDEAAAIQDIEARCF